MYVTLSYPIDIRCIYIEINCFIIWHNRGKLCHSSGLGVYWWNFLLT